MAFATFRNVKITGISVVVPEKEISIFDELEFYDNNLKKVQRMNKIVGFNKRRVTEEGITPTDYAAQAAEALISKLNIDRSTIDALINVEQKLTYDGPVDALDVFGKYISFSISLLSIKIPRSSNIVIYFSIYRSCKIFWIFKLHSYVPVYRFFI